MNVYEYDTHDETEPLVEAVRSLGETNPNGGRWLIGRLGKAGRLRRRGRNVYLDEVAPHNLVMRYRGAWWEWWGLRWQWRIAQKGHVTYWGWCVVGEEGRGIQW